MPSARLHPGHYEARPLPDEIAAYASTPEMLPAGCAGKVALLELDFAPSGGRTELCRRHQQSPLQIMRPLYFDPERPDLAIVFLMSGAPAWCRAIAIGST